MNDEKLNKLTSLRDRVMENVTPLVDNEDLSPEQRFTLLMSAASYQGDEEKLEKAFEAAQQIQADDAKSAALLDLLDEVELQISDLANTDGSEEDQPSDEPEASHQEGENQEEHHHEG